MSDHNSASSRLSQALGTAAPILPATGELTLFIYPRAYDSWTGSRAQLEAEGFAPPDGEWPNAYDRLYWQASGFDYLLCRQRPDGAKGPRKTFADCDHWCLRRDLTATAGQWHEADLYKKRQELTDIQRRQTREGSAQFERYWKSTKDKRFQAFKAACGIIEKRRGRPCKSIDAAQGDTA